jgi:DNA-binding MarR family transcriptional regulator
MKRQEFYSPGQYQRDQSIGWLLNRAKQSIGALCDLRLAGHGLTHSQWMPLLRLYLCGPMSVAGLVRELDVDAGAVTRMLDRLEAKQLCRRERSSEDRRVVMVSLSEEGKRQSAELLAVLSDVFNAHLDGFTHDEWRTLITLLHRFIANGDALRAAAESNPTSAD